MKISQLTAKELFDTICQHLNEQSLKSASMEWRKSREGKRHAKFIRALEKATIKRLDE